MTETKKQYGSIVGVMITVAIGFILYFFIQFLGDVGSILPYNEIVAKADSNMISKFFWMLTDFTEPQFYAGVIPSIAIIIGGCIAYVLSLNNSKYKGFSVCYGSNVFPWVLASQILALVLVNFVFNYTKFFTADTTWIPTFIPVASVPPAIILLYGPSISSLLTGSILGGLVSFPIANWLGGVVSKLGLPGVIANVLTMAIAGAVIYYAAKFMPWMKKVEPPAFKYTIKKQTEEERLTEMSGPLWFVRRVFADFSEAQFYGNEIAGIFVVLGAVIGVIFTGHITNGASNGLIASVILSQFISSAVGIFIYFNIYLEKGWCASYVPVVSAAPACVLLFGGGIPVAIIGGLLGGIIGIPLAELFNKNMPEGIHITVGNVLSMAATTAIVALTMGMFF